jgi:hypothetical protein
VPDENQLRARRDGAPPESSAERTSYLPRIAARRPVAPNPDESALHARSGELPETPLTGEPGVGDGTEPTLGSRPSVADAVAISAATRELPVVDADGHGDSPAASARAVPDEPDVPLLTHGADTMARGAPAPVHDDAGHAVSDAPRAAAAQPARTRRAGRRRRGPVVAVLAVVLLAAAAGVAYWLVARPSDASPAAPQQTAAKGAAGAGAGRQGRGTARAAPSSGTVGAFSFTRHHAPVRDRNCAQHSYGRTRQFLAQTPCRSMTRVLYESETPKGTVVSSVSVVRMPSAAQAAALKQITDSSGTGNVTDLVSDGINVPAGPQKIRGKGYASALHGDTVTIVESGFVNGDAGNAYLKRVSAAAARIVT